MNGTLSVNFPRASSVLFVGSLWLVALTLILAVRLAAATSAAEVVGTLVAVAIVGFGAAAALRAAVVISRDEKQENSPWYLPMLHPHLGASKAKSI